MDGAGAREIVETDLRQPAAAPDPVGFNGIDQRGDDTGIDTVGKELGAFCHGAGNDGGGGGTEHQVEHKAGEIKAFIGGKQVKAGLADEAEKILAHQQAEADDNEYHRAYTEIHQVLHDDVAGILGAGKACLYHGKACLHPEYQRGADQKPYTPYFTHNLTSLFCGPGGSELFPSGHRCLFLSRFSLPPYRRSGQFLLLAPPGACIWQTRKGVDTFSARQKPGSRGLFSGHRRATARRWGRASSFPR